MLYNKLYDWQKEVVDFVSTKRLYGLWLDCGLGKTVQALALVERNNASKVLIVTPNAKACETIDTPGSWYKWAKELDGFTIINKQLKQVWPIAATPKGKTGAALTPQQSADSLNSSVSASAGGNAANSITPANKTIGRINMTVSASSVPPVQDNPFPFKQFRKEVWVVNYESLFDHKCSGTRPQLKDSVLAFINSCRLNHVTLLLDESHYIKESNSKQALALSQIKRELMLYSESLHCYLLTGTPFTRGFIDVYNQLKFMGCQMTKTAFKDKFCVLGNVRGLLGWQQPIIGYKNVEELYKLMHNYAITLKSNDVIKLPDQIFTEKTLAPSRWFEILTRKTIKVSAMTALNNARKKVGLPSATDTDLQIFLTGKNPMLTLNDKNSAVANPWFRNIDFPDTDYLCDTPGSLWLRARELSIGFQGNADKATWYDRTRLNTIKDFLNENPGNYVLFYNYVPEFVELFDICSELGYNIDVYNGEIKSLTNYERYDAQSPDLQAQNNKNIILSNFASGSTGMNWQSYSSCIISSLPTYKHWAQGLKRVHRTGSKETVNYYVFKSDNWLDRGMWDALMQGVEYSNDMFNKALNEAQPDFDK